MNIRVIAVAAAAVILLGAGGLLFYNKSKSPSTNTATQTTNSTPGSNSKTIFDLLASGQSQECSFTYTGETDGNTSGVFYIADGKMRGDMTTQAEGKTTQFYIIRSGNDTYMWGSELTQGIKMTISEEELKSNEEASSYMDLNANYNYDCKPWSTDNSKFTPPSNIKFTDLSGLMEGAMKANPTGGSIKMDASACASISDPGAKTACEKAVAQ